MLGHHLPVLARAHEGQPELLGMAPQLERHGRQLHHLGAGAQDDHRVEWFAHGLAGPLPGDAPAGLPPHPFSWPGPHLPNNVLAQD